MRRRRKQHHSDFPAVRLEREWQRCRGYLAAPLLGVFLPKGRVVQIVRAIFVLYLLFSKSGLTLQKKGTLGESHSIVVSISLVQLVQTPKSACPNKRNERDDKWIVSICAHACATVRKEAHYRRKRIFQLITTCQMIAMRLDGKKPIANVPPETIISFLFLSPKQEVGHSLACPLSLFLKTHHYDTFLIKIRTPQQRRQTRRKYAIPLQIGEDSIGAYPISYIPQSSSVRGKNIIRLFQMRQLVSCMLVDVACANSMGYIKCFAMCSTHNTLESRLFLESLLLMRHYQPQPAKSINLGILSGNQ